MAVNDYIKWFTGEGLDRALTLESTIIYGVSIPFLVSKL
jgi:hypothetical protein